MKEIGEGTFYFPGATNVGIVISGNRAMIIDTGLDEDFARKVLRSLRERELALEVIINTHSHADHIGGNNFLQKRTRCAVLSSKFERAFIETPILEPLFLFSGASPISELKSKFTMAKPSKVTKTLEAPGEIEFYGRRLEIVPLPGHSLGQIGIAVDGILFCADSFFSRPLLEKYKIPFFVDIEKELDTLEWILSSDYDFYVPSHVSPGKDLSEIMEENIRRIEGISTVIESLSTGIWIEDLISRAISSLGASPRGIPQYLLLRTALLAYVTCLKDQDRISLELRGDKIVCTKVP